MLKTLITFPLQNSLEKIHQSKFSLPINMQRFLRPRQFLKNAYRTSHIRAIGLGRWRTIPNRIDNPRRNIPITVLQFPR